MKDICLTTPVETGPPLEIINHKSNLYLLGSCFADNIGEKLRDNLFTATVNPFGPLYNPLSITDFLWRVIENRGVDQSEIFKRGEEWCSFIHHTSLNSNSHKDYIDRVNRRFSEARSSLLSSDILILTLGTAYYWKDKSCGRAVANCQRVSNSAFERRLSSPDEIADSLIAVVERLYELLPEISISITVSPVIYQSKDPLEATVAKSNLHSALPKIFDRFPEIKYFPAYEILNRELRDYRFYGDDLCHPSAKAIDIIWSMFAKRYICRESLSFMDEFDPIRKLLKHRSKELKLSPAMEKKRDDLEKRYSVKIRPSIES